MNKKNPMHLLLNAPTHFYLQTGITFRKRIRKTAIKKTEKSSNQKSPDSTFSTAGSAVSTRSPSPLLEIAPTTM